ncbi:hypothetical protein AVEN_120046-1 [Araneus ventricosus]|uniref:Uncharacterized protein n=1 Tax=Araneus ventricosus TaxID=182803 RepID=A0A4Y2W1J2_ARAVE|nr:hypothetical protein AVEN_120046-1 [Araneus ventricosus]
MICGTGPHTGGSSVNRVSSLKPSGPEVENLPLGHRSPNRVLEVEEMKGETPKTLSRAYRASLPASEQVYTLSERKYVFIYTKELYRGMY